MKVLLIGQLPKEVGGNYTTGAANVVYELSKNDIEGVHKYTFATNLAASVAKEISQYDNQYIGYSFNFLSILWRIVRNPLSLVRRLRHYRSVDHQSCARLLFYEDNIARAINALNPDIIHVNSIKNMSSTYFALDGKDIPILLTCHGIFFKGDKDDIIGRDIYMGNLGFAKAYTGLTHESLDEYEKYLGIPREKVDIIPNGVDCKKFYFSSEERLLIRKQFGVAESCKVFITVASVQERKGQLEFIKLLEKLDLDFQYWIVGKGPDEDLINKYIKEHNLLGKIKMFGYCDSKQLYKYYSAADVYVHSSWKEGQALSELEANAAGLRTIVNKAIVGTIANDVNSEDYFVLDFNSLDYSNLLRWLEASPINRQSRKHFDWSIINAKYSRLYNLIITKKDEQIGKTNGSLPS